MINIIAVLYINKVLVKEELFIIEQNKSEQITEINLCVMHNRGAYSPGISSIKTKWSKKTVVLLRKF